MALPMIIEPVTKADILGLASWDRERSDNELKDLIGRRSSQFDDLHLFEEEN